MQERSATRAFVVVSAILLLLGCAPKQRNEPITTENFRPGYGYRQANRASQALPGQLVVVTFSGGGTRAAALAQGVLREFAATRIPGGPDRTLLDEIDLVSSVSGGSVTAANFALYGRDGFEEYERQFLNHDGMTTLIAGTLNPLNWPRFWFTSDSRIDLLVEMLDERVYHGATFGDLKREGGPFLILNAADMTSGIRFTFTQSTFDLLCSDLTRFRIAEAVAASAAYPVGLTPITLTNYSPCAAQRSPEGQDLLGRVRSDQGEGAYTDGFPERSADDVVFVDTDDVLPRRSSGLREGRLLNRDGRKNFVHLLDGGIADNLGLAEPLQLMSASAGRDGAPPDEIAKSVVVVVNARSDPATERDLSADTPGPLAMGLSAVNAAIDGRSGGLQAQLSLLPQLAGEDKSVDVISVDFELIRNPECRQAFADVGTNWDLDKRVVESLMEMGGAMVRASPHYRKLAQDAGGEVQPDDGPGGNTSPGQLRAQQACDRLMNPRAVLPPVRFGNIQR